MHWQFVNLGASKIADLSMEWGRLWDNIGAVCIVGILGLPTNSVTLSSFSLHFLVVVVFIKMPY